MINKTPFAIAFSKFLRENGVKTFYALSQKTGINVMTCRYMFRPDYPGPSFNKVQILANSFGFSPGDFIRILEKKCKKLGKLS